MKIITSNTEPNSQCSWAPDLGIRDDSRPQLGDLRQLAGKMQNSKPVIEYRRGSPNLQLSGQDHHSDQQVPFMCGIQCLWENLQVLLEMQNTLHPLHISLQQSYMDLAPSCSLFLRMFVGFFSRWPRFNTKWKEALSTIAIVWHLGEFTETVNSGAVHLTTSTSFCGEQSCCVCVHLPANSLGFKHVCQTGLFSRLWWTKSACLSVSSRIEFVWEVLMQQSRKLWALLWNCKRDALATSIKKDNRFWFLKADMG